MKLFRSDLITGFKNKLFETELKKTDNENIVLDSNKLICELSSFEVAEVLKFMEARLEVRGVDISNNVIGFAGSGQGAATEAVGATAVEEVQEKVAFDIKLSGFDAKAKIKVIKEVRAITGLGLKEAKTLVEGVPNTIKTNIKKEEAEEIKERLEAVGASVDIE